MEDTPYFEYAIDNQIIGKNSDFIEKKSGSARFVFAIVYRGNIYRNLERLFKTEKSLYLLITKGKLDIYFLFQRKIIDLM